MSILDLDALGDLDLITHYVLECRGKGLFLPYDEHDLIVNWLRHSKDANRLLIILSDLLPPFFDGRTAKPKSLRRINTKVLKKIKEYNMYNPF
ncbi:MAG: hypothetical protein AB7T49_13955 [Oligoflexales bacterium]